MSSDRYSEYLFVLLEFVFNCKCRTREGESLKTQRTEQQYYRLYADDGLWWK